jgi:hypothetical protein
MTTDERAQDTLRALLRREAEQVPVRGDGLPTVLGRVQRRRAVRRWLWPTAALVTAATAVSLVLFVPDDPRRTDSLTPGNTGYDGAALYPITSYSHAERLEASGRAAEFADSRAVTEDFVALLGLDGVSVGVSGDVSVKEPCTGCTSFTLQAAGQDVGTVALAHYDVKGARLYTVLSVGGTDLTVTSPAPGQQVSSPLQVSGRVPGVDENVRLTLRAMPLGTVLADTSSPAGSAAPWRATVTWTGSSGPVGALSAVTRSARDGSVTRLAVVPLVLTAQSVQPPRDSFVGIVDGHVSRFDAATGAVLQQLTFPPAGASDSAATWAEGTLVWARTRGASACISELNQRTPTATTTITSSTTALHFTPRLSDDGGWLGWVEQPCDGSPSTLVVRGGNGPERRIPGPSGSIVRLFDVRDDGALLVLTNDREATGPGSIGLVAPGAQVLDGLTALEAEPGCYLASGAAFDGQGAVAFQTCEDGIQLIRYSATGSVLSKDPALTNPSPQSVSAHDGALLVWLASRDRDGGIARYANNELTVVVSNEGCSADSGAQGCVRDPAW